MNREELANLVAAKLGGTKADGKAALDAVIAAIEEGLATTQELQITNFGVFTATATPERPGRNPKTGAVITIPAGLRISFRPGKGLKENANPANAPKKVAPAKAKPAGIVAKPVAAPVKLAPVKLAPKPMIKKK